MPIGSIPPRGSIPPAIRRRGYESKPALEQAPRVWVFAKGPPFARFQRTLGVQRVKEPSIDVFNETNQVTLVAQLPGTSMKEISLDIRDDVAVLEAGGALRGDRVHYYREVLLPFDVEPAPQKMTFNNGILEVDLRKKEMAS
ncbi:MAG: Hsp20/alpha crystallin family protein [Acidobacteria bacterium]|nr:Hsp20/alpha crystallin family protein [Acidobacteriota bacterium]MBI3654836.1 Hsp20/alpha crystallin family protein [Acidobacteriota bacterium]